jgi:hypothetical protein
MRSRYPLRHNRAKVTPITTTQMINVTKSFTIEFGGGGGIRTPEGCYTLTVFKTVAIDHSATPPTMLAGRAGGTRTPNRRFWRPLLYQLSYRPIRCRPKPKFKQWRTTLLLNLYAIISLTRPAPIVRPPSRMAKRWPFSIATGAITFISTETLSPGITISTP